MADEACARRAALVQVFSLLSVVDLCQASAVCREWRDASLDESLWARLYFARRPRAIVPRELNFRTDVVAAEAGAARRERAARRMTVERQLWQAYIGDRLVRPQMRFCAWGLRVRLLLVGEAGTGKRTLVAALAGELRAAREAELARTAGARDEAGTALRDIRYDAASDTGVDSRGWLAAPSAFGPLSLHVELAAVEPDTLAERAAGARDAAPDLVIFVVSTDSVRSVESAGTRLARAVSEAWPHVAAAVVVTKADLPTQLRAVKRKQVEALASELEQTLAFPDEPEPSVPVMMAARGGLERELDGAAVQSGTLAERLVELAMRPRGPVRVGDDCDDDGTGTGEASGGGGGVWSKCVVA